MNKNSFICFALLALLPIFSYASSKNLENVYPRVCKAGAHSQPNGQFAAYVFCDDAFGTNIAVMHVSPGDSAFSKWPIDRRFWQGEPWAKDVSSLGWVPGRNFLIVATSEVYGEGSTFLLDLENQTATVLWDSKDGRAEITGISETAVTLQLTKAMDDKQYKTVVIALPSNIAKKPELPTYCPPNKGPHGAYFYLHVSSCGY